MNYIFISGLSFLQTRTVKRFLIFSTNPPALQLTKEVQTISFTGSKKDVNLRRKILKRGRNVTMFVWKILFGCATHSLPAAPNQLPEAKLSPRLSTGILICHFFSPSRQILIFRTMSPLSLMSPMPHVTPVTHLNRFLIVKIFEPRICVVFDVNVMLAKDVCLVKFILKGFLKDERKHFFKVQKMEIS